MGERTPAGSARAGSRAGRVVAAAVVAVAFGLGGSGCGSRTELALFDLDAGVYLGPCEEGVVEPCGSDVGACQMGLRTCVEETFGACEGEIRPVAELCNDIDDDCDGSTDEDFGVGEACDGSDLDECLDDVMSCQGCSQGPDLLETCNGVDDDCDGIVDADCASGSCSPTLVVTGSTPSSPSCVDFPVVAGSLGGIQYPCGGGMVTAQLGAVSFSGTVQGGGVFLEGTAIISAEQSPDDCVWLTTHHIAGDIPSGQLRYDYSEMPIEGFSCWSPCTEVGTVVIEWR